MQWVLIFFVPPFEFWIMLVASTLVLMLIAIFASGGRINVVLSAKLFLLGALSAGLLYELFFLGYDATRSIALFNQGVNRIYALRLDEPTPIIALLLIFPIALGEELYWRGLIQRTLSDKLGRYAGLTLGSAAYCLVHTPTFNLPLILASLMIGLTAGGLYAVTKNLTAGIVSHVFWSLMIFVFLPLH